MDNPAPETPPGVNVWSGVVPAVRIIFIVLVCAWLAWMLASNPSNLEDLANLWKLSGAWLFLLGWMVIPIGLWLLWRLQLHLLTGQRLPFSTTISIQAIAWGGRYMPGKAGLWLAKTALTRDTGLGWRVLSGSVLAEQLLFLIAGALVALIAVSSLQPDMLGQLPDPLAQGLRIVSGHPLPATIVLGAIMLAAIWGFSGLLARSAVDATARINWYHWPLLLSAHVGIHLIAGISLYPLIEYLLPEAAAALGPFGIAGALALANVAGIAAVFAPAGLGVREAVLAIVLAVGAEYEQALAVAVMLRVITLFSDALFAVGGWILGKLCEP